MGCVVGRVTSAFFAADVTQQGETSAAVKKIAAPWGASGWFASDAAVTDQLGLEVNAQPGAFTELRVRRERKCGKSEIVIAAIA